MRLALLLLPASLIFAAPALAETRSYDLRDFSKLDISTAYDVVFTQGPNWSVVVDSEYNNLDKVIVEKRGDTLVVRRPDGPMRQEHLHDVVRITAPNIRDLHLHTAVKFTADRLDSLTLDIDANTAVKIEIGALKTETLTIRGDTAASLQLSGQCGKLELSLSAASKVDAHDLKCREAKVEADAASSARVFASNTLMADASSASSIRVSGKPPSVQQHKDMVSSITLTD